MNAGNLNIYLGVPTDTPHNFFRRGFHKVDSLTISLYDRILRRLQLRHKSQHVSVKCNGFIHVGDSQHRADSFCRRGHLWPPQHIITRLGQPNYLPLNCAARFSRNAVVPSFLSSVAQAAPNSTASRYSPSASVISKPLFTASIVYCTASGALAMIFAAIASAREINSAGATTSFTSPIRCASCAVIISPVSTSCIATPLPTSRGRRCVPP